MPINPTTTFGLVNRLMPLYDPESAKQLPINLADNASYVKGQVLALLAARNEIQAITGSSSITGGTYTITLDGRTTTAINYNDNAATIQTAVAALANVGTGNVGVSGGPLNTSTPLVVTFQGTLANRNMSLLVVNTSLLTGSQVVAVAITQNGRTTATYGAYSSAVQAAPVGAPVPTAVAGSGFPAGVYTVGYTYVTTSGGETTLSPLATVTTSAGNLAIGLAAVTPLPTGVVSVNWYVSTLAGSTSLAFATNNNGGALTLQTSSSNVPVGGAKAPPSANTGYSEAGGSGQSVAKMLLVYPVTVDANGQMQVLEIGPAQDSVPAYMNGTFDLADIVGLDAKAVVDLGGEIVVGSISSGAGVFRFG
jgi:hypothetical protein